MTRLVLEQAGGSVTGPLVDVTVPAVAARTADRPRIVVRVAEVQRILGTTEEDAVLASGRRTSGLDEAVVMQLLSALGCQLEPTGGAPGEYGVKLPSWRLDLEREIDLIEEVARVYGYNRFADTLPGWSGEVHTQPHKAQETAIRSTLCALGYTEAVSSTFSSAEEAATFGTAGKGAVAMGNPLSEEAGALRSSLLPGMVGMLAQNLARDTTTVRLFELGTVFAGSTAAVHEQPGLVLGATGGASSTALHRSEDALLFAVKGAVEGVLARFSGDLRFEPGTGQHRCPHGSRPAAARMCCWRERRWGCLGN